MLIMITTAFTIQIIISIFLHVGSQLWEHVEFSGWEVCTERGQGEVQLLRVVQGP